MSKKQKNPATNKWMYGEKYSIGKALHHCNKPERNTGDLNNARTILDWCEIQQHIIKVLYVLIIVTD